MRYIIVSPVRAWAALGLARAEAAALATKFRSLKRPVIHVHFIVDPGAPGITTNAPLFRYVRDAPAHVRGTEGAAPIHGLEPKPGDFVLENVGFHFDSMLISLRPHFDSKRKRRPSITKGKRDTGKCNHNS